MHSALHIMYLTHSYSISTNSTTLWSWRVRQRKNKIPFLTKAQNNSVFSLLLLNSIQTTEATLRHLYHVIIQTSCRTVQWTSRNRNALLLLQQMDNNLGPVQEIEAAGCPLYSALGCTAIDDCRRTAHLISRNVASLHTHSLNSKSDFIPV